MGFTRQPQTSAQIDPGNPITRGLVIAAMPGLFSMNLANKVPFGAGGGSRLLGAGGIGAIAATAGSFLTVNATLGTNYTVFAFGEISTVGVQGSPIDEDDGTTRSFLFRINSTGGADFIPFTSSNGFVVCSSANFTASQLLAGVSMAGTVDNSGNAAVWGNGIKTTGSLGAAPRSPSTTIALLNRKTGGTQIPTTRAVLLTLVWNRVLTDAELRSLSINPWQIFLSPVRRLFAPPAGIALDAVANSGYQAAQSSYTFNRTVTGSNTFLAVDVSLLSAGQTVTSVVDDFGGTNVNAVFVGAQSTVSAVGRVEMWRVVAPVAGTKAIQVNLSGSIASAATAVSYTGVHQTSPTEGFNSAQATNVGAADATVSVTTVADNCWVHGAIATDDIAITANQTSRNNVTGAGGSAANEDNNGPKTPAGAVTMSYTGVGALATWAIGGYAIRPVASSGLGGRIFFQSMLNGLGAAGKFFRNPLG